MNTQEQTDAQHLKLLSIFHYVLAGFYLLGVGFLILHYFMMNAIMTMAEDAPVEPGSPPPPDMEEFMAIFVWFYVFMGLACLLLLVGNILAGNALRARRSRTLVLIVAGVNCLNMPLGTVLGIFTFIVLLRQSVAELFRPKT
ncbi:MAG: hypothetical protein HKN82_03700 [Akkermansiaceae bacterium]|nr:hypothetical protein [Akkermansiaceae bacterium]